MLSSSFRAINYSVKHEISCSALKLNDLNIQKLTGIWTHIATMSH